MTHLRRSENLGEFCEKDNFTKDCNSKTYSTKIFLLAEYSVFRYKVIYVIPKMQKILNTKNSLKI